MTTPPPSPSKSLTPTPDVSHAARPAGPEAAVGEPKGAARKGVPFALRPDPRAADGRYPVAWLNVRAPYGATPSATSTCLCGRHETAFGKRQVLALIADHDDHRYLCPLRNPLEGRTAS